MSKRLLSHTKAIRNLISTPDKWTKGAFARNSLGDPVSFDSEEAVCHCLSGASLWVHKLYPIDENFHEEFAKTASCMGYVSYAHMLVTVAFNDRDTTTHADILRILDQMISDLSV